MIIVDASVVIDYIRSQDPKLQALLLALPVAICGVTRAEVCVVAVIQRIDKN